MLKNRIVVFAAVVLATVAAGGAAPAAVVTPQPGIAPTFDGSVQAIAYRGDVVFVGGTFSAAVTGGRTVARQRLAAFNARTGTLLDWNPGAPATVRALAVDGDTVYAAGDFGRVAGFSSTTGAPTSFTHPITGVTNALVAANGRLYAGGRFTAADAAPRTNLAAFTLATGALDRWAPAAADTVDALAASGDQVYVGGTRLSRVDAATGALDKDFAPQPASPVSALATDPSGIYAALGSRAAAYTFSGATRWSRTIDAQAITQLDDVTYVGGKSLAAVDHNGHLLGWAPKTTGRVLALASGTSLGTVSVGGDFTSVAGKPRKGYAAFSVAQLTEAPGPVPTPTTDQVATYTFDQGNPLPAATRNGGAVTLSAHGTGHALRFPAACVGVGCPRVVLQVAGSATTAFGANVLVGGAPTAQTVLQQGIRLQVASGLPSCVLNSAEARSASSVADGAWHTLECRRTGANLSVVVDKRTQATTLLPATIQAAAAQPLTIGGTGVGDDNDQFHGSIDDVWIKVG